MHLSAEWKKMEGRDWEIEHSGNKRARSPYSMGNGSADVYTSIFFGKLCFGMDWGPSRCAFPLRRYVALVCRDGGATGTNQTILEGIPCREESGDSACCSGSTLSPHMWSCPGDAGFMVRGPDYLRDRVKVPAGPPIFDLAAVDLLEVDQPVFHVARYLPSLKYFALPPSLPASPHVCCLCCACFQRKESRGVGDY